MKSRLPWISLGLVMTAGLALADGPNHLRAELTGYQEVPALSTTGSGQLTLQISPDGSMIHYELGYSGLQADALQAHIHLGQAAVNGGVSVFLCTNLGNGPAGTPACPLREGTVSGTFTAGLVLGPAAQGISPGELDELLAALRSGVTYANVHSTQWPGGEIRGQIGPGQRATPN